MNVLDWFLLGFIDGLIDRHVAGLCRSIRAPHLDIVFAGLDFLHGK
jgi:hypothetical protein